MDNNNNNINNTPIKQCIESRAVDETTITNANAIIMHMLLIMCFLSICLQIIVIINALRYIRRHASECYMHIFLLNMTLADLMLTGIALPMEFLIEIDTIRLHFSYHTNLMMHFLLWLGTSVSGLNLVLLNVEKLIFFKFPLRYSELVTRNRAYLAAFSTWFLSVIFIWLAFHTRALICRYNCERLTTDNTRYGPLMYLFFTFFVSAFPALSSLMVALYLLRIVSNHRKQIAEEQKLCTVNGICKKNTAMKSGMRTFYYIFISTIFTVLTLTPYRLVTLYRTIIDKDTVIRTCSSVFISVLTYYAMDLNPILNPLLTVTVLPQYRLRCLNFLIPVRPTNSLEETCDK
uniref:G-protein coupled receptors family 1 profile domain-containing protein n=1 Tax=Setaria digitata TaxID=48799 RepID=A0A915PZ02_9BILA